MSRTRVQCSHGWEFDMAAAYPLRADNQRVSSASLYEAVGQVGALPSTIRPIRPGMHLTGSALTVKSPPGDNLWLHRAIYAARPGDVLVVDVGSGLEYGYWGEIMTVAAQARGVAGLVISGGIRDSDQLASRGFPTFAGTVCLRGTAKDASNKGEIGGLICLGGVTVRYGDFVVADSDGVVVVPRDQAAEAVGGSLKRDAAERQIISRLNAGESTLDIYGLPPGGI